MSAFFGSPHLVDLVLVVLLIETLALRFLRAGATSWVNIAAAALPGLFLLLALRAALAGAGWSWVALWLAASFPAHLFDLWRRPP